MTGTTDVFPTRRLLDGGDLGPIDLVLQTDDHNFIKIQWRQWLACINATLTMVVVGTVYGWTTSSLVHLTSGTGDVPLVLTNDESSWIVSLTVIGSMIGPFISAYFADNYGRKYSLLLCSTIFASGWMIIRYATKVSSLYIARVVLGIGVGIAYTVNPMYVSEVADINIRGALGTLIAVNVYTGSLLTCTLGLWLTYKSLLTLLVMLPIASFFLISYFPETPYFLVKKGRKIEASKSLAYFKCIVDPQEMKVELAALRAQLKSDLRLQSRGDMRLQPRGDTFSQSRDDTLSISSNDSHRANGSEDGNIYTWVSKLQLLLQPNNRKALCIMLGLIMAQQFSGNFSTMQYLEMLFKKTAISVNANIATVLVLGVGLVSGTFSTLMVEHAGRRILLILSTFGSFITLLLLAMYLFFAEHNYDVSIFSVLPVFNVIIYQIMYQIGLGTLPNALIGELFPAEVKGIAGAIIVIFDGIIGFTVSKLYQVITDTSGSYLIYIIFAISCFLAFLMVVIWIPETKGKTYREIQALLTGENLNTTNEPIILDQMETYI